MIKEGEDLVTFSDIASEFLPLLSEQAQIDIAKDEKDTFEGEDFVIKCHSVTYRTQKDKAINKIAKCVQEVSDSVGLVGFMHICGHVEITGLTDYGVVLPKCVFSFIAIPADKSEEYDQKFMGRPGSTAVLEGDVGQSVED